MIIYKRSDIPEDLLPYFVRAELGLEPTPAAYIAKMVEVLRELRRVLAKDGTLWLNMGDSYANDGKWGGHTGGKHVKALHCSPIGRNKKYTGLKPKDMMMMPHRLAIALQDDGWWVRADIIWHKPNPMPESVRDRPTKSHEYLFLLAKSERYYYNADAIKEAASPDSHARYARGRSDEHKWADGGPGNQSIAKSFDHMLRVPAGWHQGARASGSAPRDRRTPGVNPKNYKGSDFRRQRNLDLHPDIGRGERQIHIREKQNPSFSAAVKDVVEVRNKRSVWTIAPQPFKGAHFATFPEKLVAPCVLAGSREGDLVIDPFCGSGTVGVVAGRLGRRFLGIDLNPEYLTLARERLGMPAETLGMPAETEACA